MDLLDKVLLEWSARTDKGYPDLNNKQDLALFESMFGINLQFESPNYIPTIRENSESYDKLIKDKLEKDNLLSENGQIPKPAGSYKFPGKFGGNYKEEVNPKDLALWRSLWTLKPPTKSGEADSLGVGKGEVSLYWLYNYADNGVSVDEGREGDDPDLFMNGIGVEVKAYKSGTGQISLGRFGADKENLKLLSVAFGLNALVNVLDQDTSKKVLNPTNFNGSELEGIFDNVNKFASLRDLDQLASNYSIFNNIKQNINTLVDKLGSPNTSEEAARNMATLILSSKLNRKPGNGGYLTNVSSSGTLHWWSIDIEKINNSQSLLSAFAVSQSKIKLNFAKVLS